MALRSELRCTYCGGRGHGAPLLEVDVRGIRYDYCDAACATAHRQAVELTGLLCADCDDDVLGDCGACGEHLDGEEHTEIRTAPAWLRAG